MIQYSLYLLINKYNIFISHKGTIRAKREEGGLGGT